MSSLPLPPVQMVGMTTVFSKTVYNVLLSKLRQFLAFLGMLLDTYTSFKGKTKRPIPEEVLQS